MSWYKSAIIYQIYPRSFFDSNGDGIGDIQGIIQKLDYIQSIGFNTIWISPFFCSPQIDFGYDISDYLGISNEYGTMYDVEELISATHNRDMKIVFDLVMNHTSNQHQWFLDSCNKTNDKADWYIWRKGKSNKPPNNWINIIGKRAWQYHEERQEWFLTSFMPFQPDLNYSHPEVKATMFDIVRFWLNKGVDGFRLDIFNCIIKDADFRDNPFYYNPLPSEENPGGRFQFKKYNVNHPDNYKFAQELRAVVDEFEDRFLLGEVMGSHHAIMPFLADDKGLHLIFLFDMVFFKFNATWFANKLKEYETYYPAPYIPTCVFSNHDQWRSIRRVGNDIEKAKILAVIQFTIRAVPTTYYGEEIGLENANIPMSEAQDSLSAYFRWVPEFVASRLPVVLNRDNCRTPMHWDSCKNGGFCKSAILPWLPATNFKSANVATQSIDKNSLLTIYKKLIELRKTYKALSLGTIENISSKNNVLYYERVFEEERICVWVDFEKKGYMVTLDCEEIYSNIKMKMQK